MIKKQQILDAFDKAIENSKNSDSESLPIAVGFIVCLTGQDIKMGIGIEIVVVDEVNMQRKRDYLAEKLDDDGFYLGTNQTVQVGSVFSDYIPTIGQVMATVIADFYVQIIGDATK